MTIEKFNELKSRFTNLKKAAGDKDPLKPQGHQPLSTTTRSSPDGSQYKESGREIAAAGTPQQHAGKINAEIQTRATDFSPGAVERRKAKDAVAAEKEAATREQFGQFADTAGAKSIRQEAPALTNAVSRFADETDRVQKDPLKFKGGGTEYLGHVFNDLANRFEVATPLPSLEAQRADVTSHHKKMALKNAEKVAANRLSFVTGANILTPRAAASEAIPQTGVTQNMTDEQIAQTYPKYQTAADVGNSQQYKDFVEQMPTGSFNMITANRLARQMRHGLTHVSFYHNLMNTPRQLAESRAQVNLERKDPDRMYSADPTTNKDPVSTVMLPGHHAELYLPGSHPPATIDHESFMEDASRHTPDQWGKKIANAQGEKHSLTSRLGQAQQALSDASNAHATGKSTEFVSHLQRAKEAATGPMGLEHNNTQEAQQAHKWLSALPGLIDTASTLSHAPDEKGRVQIRDAMRQLRDKTAGHIKKIGHLGDAFDEKHVVRADPSKLWTKDNLEQIQAHNPDASIRQTPADYMAEKPGATTQRFEETQPIVYSHPVHHPENVFTGFIDRLRYKTAGEDQTKQPGALLPGVNLHEEYRNRQQQSGSGKDNSLVQEMKDFLAHNHLRHYTHPHEFANEPPPHPFADDFLNSVPMTEMHNHFEPNENLTLGGKPARQFVEGMTKRIAEAGMNHLDAEHKMQFSQLNHKHQQHLPMSPEEARAYGDLQSTIADNGEAELIRRGAVNHRDLHDFKMARFMAASRQQRKDYLGPDSSHSVLNEAEEAHRTHTGDELIAKLKDLKGRVPAQNWSQMAIDKTGAASFAKPEQRSTRVRTQVRRDIENMIKQALEAKKSQFGKSMTDYSDRLKKARESLLRIKNLTKALPPQGKYIRASDGTLVLVDRESQTVQTHQKEVQQAQQKSPIKPPTPPVPPKQPPPAAPKQPDLGQYWAKPKPAPAVPKQPAAPMGPAPKMPVTENIEGAVQQAKADAAMNAFNYKPKR
jgi:hypothetical protein